MLRKLIFCKGRNPFFDGHIQYFSIGIWYIDHLQGIVLIALFDGSVIVAFQFKSSVGGLKILLIGQIRSIQGYFKNLLFQLYLLLPIDLIHPISLKGYIGGEVYRIVSEVKEDKAKKKRYGNCVFQFGDCLIKN